MSKGRHFWRNTEATTHVASLDFPNHNIKVTPLILPSAPHVGSVDEHGHRMLTDGLVLRTFHLSDVFRDLA